MSANYWIAQYIADLFRNEPRNIGVFVEIDGLLRARFVGESSLGQIDRRKLKGFEYSQVYEQWLKYWRNQINNASISTILKSSGSHYRVITGGEVDDVAGDSLEEVLNYLYALLVSEGGFYEAVGEPFAEVEVAELSRELIATFKDAALLETPGQSLPHPIRRGVSLLGKLNVPHRPAFVQQNSSLYVMETVDFTVNKKRISRDHAGWAAYMFKDIRDAHAKVEPIAIVRFTPPDEEEEEVQNGLALLRNEGHVVNWLDKDQQSEFLRERREVAAD
jgi:hypothetical protein